MYKIIPNFLMRRNAWILWSLIISSRQGKKKKKHGPQGQSNGYFLVEVFSLWIRNKAIVLINLLTNASGSPNTTWSSSWGCSIRHRADLEVSEGLITALWYTWTCHNHRCNHLSVQNSTEKFYDPFDKECFKHSSLIYQPFWDFSVHFSFLHSTSHNALYRKKMCDHYLGNEKNIPIPFPLHIWNNYTFTVTQTLTFPFTCALVKWAINFELHIWF